MWKKIFKLENLIYLTVFALPAYLLRFRAFGFSVSALDCLLLVCIAWWLIFYRKEHNWMVFLEKHKVFVFSGGLVFLSLVISALLNKQYVTGAGIVVSWFLLPMLFSLVADLIIAENKQKNIFLAYYFSAFTVALISLGYYLLGLVTYDLRLQAFFNSPNYLAMYLAPAIFIGYGLFQEIAPKKRFLLWISGAVIMGALYLTYSYASWLVIGLALGLVFAISKKLSWKKGLAGIFLLIALFFLQADRSKFSNLVNNNRSSMDSRMMIWRSAGKMLETDWLWGIGAGNFQEKYLENQKYFSPYLEWAVPHPHNLYLAFWLSGGIFGLVGFLLLVFFWFSCIFRSQKNSQLKLIGLGIMCYILFHGLVDTTYFKNDLAVVFWLLFTLI